MNRWFLVAACVVIGACGGGNSSPVQDTNYGFTATISGSLGQRIQGGAVYVYDPGHLDSGGAVTLATDDVMFRIILGHAGGLLQTGTYAVESQDKGPTYGALMEGLTPWVFDGGTLTVTSASSSTIAGSFNVTGNGSDVARVAITGFFTARLAPAPSGK